MGKYNSIWDALFLTDSDKSKENVDLNISKNKNNSKNQTDNHEPEKKRRRIIIHSDSESEDEYKPGESNILFSGKSCIRIFPFVMLNFSHPDFLDLYPHC